MKPDYKNWMPKGMIKAFLFAFLGCAAALAVFILALADGTLKMVLLIAFAALTLVFFAMTVWSTLMYRAFDYNGKRRQRSSFDCGGKAESEGGSDGC